MESFIVGFVIGFVGFRLGMYWERLEMLSNWPPTSARGNCPNEPGRTP